MEPGLSDYIRDFGIVQGRANITEQMVKKEGDEEGEEVVFNVPAELRVIQPILKE